MDGYLLVTIVTLCGIVIKDEDLYTNATSTTGVHMLRMIARFVVLQGRKLMFAAVSVVLFQVVLLWVGEAQLRTRHPLGTAIEITLNCLMTLESPTSIGDQFLCLRIAHLTGWVVSFCGWLILPIAIGSGVSFMQSERMSAQSIASMTRHAALKRGINEEAANKFSDALFELLTQLPDERESKNSNGAK